MDGSVKRVFLINLIAVPLASFIVAEFEKTLEAKLVVWQHMLVLGFVGAILGLTLWAVSEKLLRKDK